MKSFYYHLILLCFFKSIDGIQNMSCNKLEDCPASIEETCETGTFNSGTEAFEAISALNCSVWTQSVDSWPSDATVSLQEFEESLPMNGSDPKYLIMANPGGFRATTYTGQCFFSTPGCDPKSGVLSGPEGSKGIYSPLSFTSEVNNYKDFYLLSRYCLDWGQCYPEKCDDDGNAHGNNVKIYSNTKCANLGWNYPLSHNLTKLPTVEDNVGNVYVMHAFDGTNGYQEPDPTNYPEDWTLGFLDFSAEDTSFYIQPLNPLDYCSSTAYDEFDSNCLYMLVMDSTGIAYHRYIWSGVEPSGFPLEKNKLINADRITECEDYCKDQDKSSVRDSIRKLGDSIRKLRDSIRNKFT